MSTVFRKTLICLVAVFAMSAFAASAAFAANEGPKWKVHGAELKTGETRTTKFTNVGVTKLEVPKAAVTITCEKAKQSVATGVKNEIIGNGAEPGTGVATLLFEKCSTGANCKAHTAGAIENIEVVTNSELAYETETAAKNHAEPAGLIFRATKGVNEQEFVKITFTGTGCGTLTETTVNATGTRVGKAKGKAGVFCPFAPVITTEAFKHEIKCPAASITTAYNWIGGSVKPHTVGLEAFAFVAHQVGNGEIEVFEGATAREWSAIL